MRRAKSRFARFSLGLSPTGQRRVVGFSLLGIAAIAAYWSFFSDGLPIIWGPRASAAEIAEGRELFEHEWTVNDPMGRGDGLGPVFNARSCAACHFQGGLGGGGNNEHNAVGFEIHSRPGDPDFHAGTIHNYSTDPAYKESERQVRKLFPVIEGRTIQTGTPNCPSTTIIPDFDPVRTESIQTTALFGAGWIDLISDRAILKNARNRGMKEAVEELKLNFNGVPVGRIRHVEGGVGKFGWKGQFATLEEFVAAACANELGLSTPTTEAAKPLAHPGYESPGPDLDKKQFRSLMAFIKTLPKPIELEGNPVAAHGKHLFGAVGCAVCHVPDMGGVKGVYSDFLLYKLDDPTAQSGRGGGGGYGSPPPPQLQLAERPDHEPKPEEWKTPALWGVADSAPYLHDGSAATLEDAINRHQGDAKGVTAKFEELSPQDKAALIAFLASLKAPPEAAPLRDPAITRLARR